MALESMAFCSNGTSDRASPGGRPLFYEGHKTRTEDAYDNRKSGSGQAGVFHQGALVRSEKREILSVFPKVWK